MLSVKRKTHLTYAGNHIPGDRGWNIFATTIGLYLFGFIRIKTYHKYHVSKCGRYTNLKKHEQR